MCHSFTFFRYYRPLHWAALYYPTKWLRRLPHPFPARDRAAGYRYQLSILQAEFSLTQVWITR
jgi:hypothetical protein